MSWMPMSIDWVNSSESHEAFPERVNVNFVQVINQRHVRIRVYERGVGETKPAVQVPVLLLRQVFGRAG